MSNKNPGCLASLFGVRTKPRPTSRSIYTPPSKDTPASAIQENLRDIQKTRLPYSLKDNFLSPAEASFYHVLKQMAGEHLAIFPQVPLANVVFVTDRDDYYTYYNKIDRKRVDFLLCESKTLRPLFAIELDDASHRQADRAERDIFVESILAQANLPLVRIPVRQSYNTQELAILFKNALQRKQVKDEAQEKIRQEAQVSDAPPQCPKCGIPMVLRTAKRGNRPGEKFWGCQNYPNCRQIVKIFSK